MKLHLGCGPACCEGWVNVDYALGARLAHVPLWRTLNRRLRIFDVDWSDQIVLHDLTKPFPWPDCSADAVYSSHTLEHLSKRDGLNFLKETFASSSRAARCASSSPICGATSMSI